MRTIKRKTLLYKTGVPTMDHCINHVAGCAHGCRYPCYAYMMKKSYGQVKSYEEWCEPKIVENALELLDRELPRLKAKIRSVHLCFSTDPFMYGYPEISELSLKIIEKINAEEIPVSNLTKGVLPGELGDKARFCADNDYGISLVSLDEGFRKRWEPGSAPYPERIAALKCLHEHGFSTWVHMEPYPTPNIVKQDIRSILDAVAFAGNIVMEGWNYNKIVKSYARWKEFYREQEKIVREFNWKKNRR